MNSLIAAGLNTEASAVCCRFGAGVWLDTGRSLRVVLNSLPAPRGVNGAAFAACEERVVFFAVACGWFDGVNAGESTLNVFFEL